jgi:ribokinase
MKRSDSVTRYAEAEILVVGSINMDLAVRCPHIPVPGETILGQSLVESPGGKGANQAVAAGRLGGRVAMIGCLGRDAYGRTLRGLLRADGVADDYLLERGERSGVALIEVGAAGENSIVVVPGANALLQPEDVERAFAAAPAARVLLLQLEIPLETVCSAAALARARGLMVILDPAPARPLPDSLLVDVDLLLPNQGEAAVLAGLPVGTREEALAAAQRLRARGVRSVLVKLGADGVLLPAEAGGGHVPGRRVTAVDSTGAGDTLAGALAVALMEGKTLPEAVAFANAAAALSTTRPGAQAAVPARAEVDRLLEGGA